MGISAIMKIGQFNISTTFINEKYPATSFLHKTGIFPG